MKIKKILIGIMGIGFLGIAFAAVLVLYVNSRLPKMFSLEDYKPLVVSEVYASNGEKIGEFFREKRVVVPYEKIPKKLVEAFLAAEDSQFFQHGGINYLSILRAALANLKAGRAAQGASTITQQVARSLLLSPEKTLIRKVREILLSYQIESHFTKEQILYLYLNQIYFGQGGYGVAAAAENYFRKSLDQITVGEMAILAGLPKAPSSYSPTHNPSSAKNRQRYVLKRMAEEGFITAEEAAKTAEQPITVYLRENFNQKAPYFVETVRQFLVKSLGEVPVLDEGLRIYTTLDIKKQLAGQKSVQHGLREIDKRQGFRGPAKNLSAVEDIAKFLLDTRNKLMDENIPTRTITPDGKALPEKLPLTLTKKKNQPNLPDFIPIGTITDAVVTKVDDDFGLVHVRFAEAQGLIDVETMKWARKPDPNVMSETALITKPSEALKTGDVIRLRVTIDKFQPNFVQKRLNDLKRKKQPVPTGDQPEYAQFAAVELEQEPQVEGALLSLDVKTGEVLSMVGGYDFERSEFNRALQAARQTGSSFKPIVYTAALDNGFQPSSTVVDAPIVYGDEGQYESNVDLTKVQKETSWKPNNYSEQFSGDILFRNALIKSLNIPTVKIEEKTGLDTVAAYARRLGIFSPLNMDLTLGLGSSSVTLYELTRVYANFARLGKRVTTPFIRKVTTRAGETLAEGITLDARFENELKKFDEEFEAKRKTFLEALAGPSPEAGENAAPAAPAPASVGGDHPIGAGKTAKLFFNDPDQLISPQTAYLTVNLLQGVVNEGTAVRARSLGRPAAGKTGTTNGYYDAWFMGFTPQIVSGVWVGLDSEKTLGRGETGGKSALPIWIEYMKAAIEDTPEMSFSAPSGIVFANIDNESGNLASASSKKVARQAFLEGTEPKTTNDDPNSIDQKSFLKEDLSD